MADFTSSSLVRFGMRPESTEGTLDTGGAYADLLTRGITPDFGYEEISDETVSGEGESVDRRIVVRRMNLDTPMHLRYGGCRVPIAAQLRETFPSEVTIVGSSNITVVASGATHLDGSTGAQIQAPTGVFDDLITYGGVNATSHPWGGAEMLMMKLSGAAAAGNNGWRRIKAVHDDTTNALIDIAPGYVGGSSGGYGGPLTNSGSAESITIRVGTSVRNRAVATSNKSYSGLWQYIGNANYGKFQAGQGLVANDLTLSWSGRAGALAEVSWIGYGSQELAATDPTGQGFDDSGVLWSRMMDSAGDLLYLAVVTPSEPIVLSQFAISDFSVTVAGGCSAIEDTAGGTTVAGVRRGKHMVEGSMGWYLADDERAQKLTALGSAANNTRGTIDVVHQDPDGNAVVYGLLNNIFAPTGPIPGGEESEVSGTLEFKSFRAGNKARTFAYQEFSA